MKYLRLSTIIMLFSVATVTFGAIDFNVRSHCDCGCEDGDETVVKSDDVKKSDHDKK